MKELHDHPTAYLAWLTDWKSRIQSAQIKAAISVNSELLKLYWELGQDIVTQQEATAWGEGLIPRFAKDYPSVLQSTSIRDALRHELTWTH